MNCDGCGSPVARDARFCNGCGAVIASPRGVGAMRSARAFLTLGAISAGALGLLALVESRGAIQEIEAFVLFLISAVLAVGAAIATTISIAASRLLSVIGRGPVPNSISTVQNETAGGKQ